MIRHVGYACVNETLKPQRFRSCRLKSVLEKGTDFLQQIILHNLNLTYNILVWNLEHDITMYRASSDMMPLVTHPDILNKFDWRWYKDEDIQTKLKQINHLVESKHIRLSMHPDQYTVLNSLRPEVVRNSIEYLAYHARLLDGMGGQDMIIHVGGVYGNKAEAMKRFVMNYLGLSDSIKKYIRIENDDKSYSINEVLNISDETGVPVVFDYHHHRCLGLSGIDEAILRRIMSSWEDKVPKMHISSGRSSVVDRSHSDYIEPRDIEAVDVLYKNYTIDVMVEAKKKELAALKMIDLLKQQSIVDN